MADRGAEPGGGRRVTITAIARAAGVSVPTVSRVVNGRSDVSPQTRERVEQLLRQHGYRGRAPRAKPSTGLLDLVFHDLTRPWAVEIIRGVTEAAASANVATVVSALDRRNISAQQWLQSVRNRSTDGVILVTSGNEHPWAPQVRRLDVPVVQIDLAGLPGGQTPTIGATNWSGGLAATEHLLSLGHRRIGMIAGPRRLLCSRARLDGYRAALDAAGTEVDEDLVRYGDFGHESGLAAATALLEMPDPPTAIFAASDVMALGVYEAARRKGLRVPEDVSVVGFDDLPEVRYAAPALTTVRQPLSEMGMLAARTVVRLASGESLESPRIELVTALVVRDSTAPPKKAGERPPVRQRQRANA
ncbi:MAG TPA: LacI family DNA-binding transcriptional regulator [Micromonosporaceae bacterium]|nr:LacI family DNA-binding transcriptional regulator [Micromonosporaceae bacterium]